MEQTQQDIRLDVREMPPRERHSTILDTFDALHPNQAIDLINDHNPKPLYYQFSAEHPGEFTWTYLQEGPEIWEVEIRRTRAETETATTATLDVRPILARGEEPFDTIMEIVAALEPGQKLELFAPFEPVPLFSVLGAQGFQHDAQPMGNGDYRVIFHKP